MAKHTQGEWKQDGQSVTANGGKSFIARCPKDHADFQFGIPRTEAEANAKLIAAAPDLLDALEAYVRADTTALTPVIPSRHNPKHVARLEQARAAIARATA